MILGLYDEAVTAGASAARVCDELGIAATTLQRWRRLGIGDDRRAGPKSTPTNKLSDPERKMVIETCCSPEFMDLSPKQIVPTLADRGVYIASESTFHRILREEKLATRRGRASAPTKRAKPPEKIATGPCQLWSWDITYLRGPARGTFFYLYVIMDVWSRKIVGRRVHLQESSEHAATLIAQACRNKNVGRDQVVLHSDNGGPMKGATMLATLQGLGVAASFSRPSVSNDNPFSESLFRTAKYRPDYPSGRFQSMDAASTWVDAFVHWYNKVHLHSSIQFVTPSSRHDGLHHEILTRRRAVYEAARARLPERWNGPVRDFEPTLTVTLNPDPVEEPKEVAA